MEPGTPWGLSTTQDSEHLMLSQRSQQQTGEVTWNPQHPIPATGFRTQSAAPSG